AVRPARRIAQRDDPRGRRRLVGRRDSAGRQPNLPGARGAGQGARVRRGRGETVRRAQDVRLRRVPDAAAAAACGVEGLAEHRDPGREERLSSAGTLVPNAELRVVDPDTLEEVPTGQQGELWFRTPQLMKGYHNKPEATAEAITSDGWFRTGDVGRVDEEGYI